MSVQLQHVSFVQKQRGIQRNTGFIVVLFENVYFCMLQVLNKNENITNAGYWVLSENRKN